MNLEDGETIYVNLQKLIKKEKQTKQSKLEGGAPRQGQSNPSASNFVTQSPTVLLKYC